MQGHSSILRLLKRKLAVENVKTNSVRLGAHQSPPEHPPRTLLRWHGSRGAERNSGEPRVVLLHRLPDSQVRTLRKERTTEFSSRQYF
jgi:hypothetical protein